MSSRRRDDDAPDPSEADLDEGSDDRDAVEILVEEFFERRRRGESSDADEFLARRVPGREAQFKRLVATLSVLEAAAARNAAPSKAEDVVMKGRERLGRFRLLRLVGRGGMGAVFEAVDDELDRRVALKILPGHVTLDEREIARFRREAHAAARLSHPHIVPIFGVGEDDGVHWLAMQFIAGESLDVVLRRMREGAARVGVAVAQNNLGNALVRLHRPDEALDHLADALSLCEAIVVADPSNAFAEGLYASACTNAGAANAALGDPASLESACDLFQKGITIYERMKAAGHLPKSHAAGFAHARDGLADALKRLSK